MPIKVAKEEEKSNGVKYDWPIVLTKKRYGADKAPTSPRILINGVPAR